MTAGGSVRLSVWIARTESARQRGLMDRRSLAAGWGMVFLYGAPTTRPFWMKDTLIPLSIAFWDSTSRIVTMLDMAPCRSDPCPLYSPGRPYDGAVEANLGFFAASRVAVGDRVALQPGSLARWGLTLGAPFGLIDQGFRWCGEYEQAASDGPGGCGRVTGRGISSHPR